MLVFINYYMMRKVYFQHAQAKWYIYVYRHKHNYILCSMFTITKVQLHVSAINIGHLQVVHDELINKLYQCVWGVYSFWGGVGVSLLISSSYTT